MGIDSKIAILANYNGIPFRNYGGGILEVLPRELENVRIPNIFDLNIEEALNLIDKVILIERMGFTTENIQVFRNIWHRLKTHRIGRGNNTET